MSAVVKVSKQKHCDKHIMYGKHIECTNIEHKPIIHVK